MTTIHYIGSYQPSHTYVTPDQAIQKLYGMLLTYTLDPRFELNGNDFIEQPGGRRLGYHQETVRFSGNFLCYSFAFCLDSDEPSFIQAMTQAIRANQDREEYQAVLQVARAGACGVCLCGGATG